MRRIRQRIKRKRRQMATQKWRCFKRAFSIKSKNFSPTQRFMGSATLRSRDAHLGRSSCGSCLLWSGRLQHSLSLWVCGKSSRLIPLLLDWTQISIMNKLFSPLWLYVVSIRIIYLGGFSSSNFFKFQLLKLTMRRTLILQLTQTWPLTTQFGNNMSHFCKNYLRSTTTLSRNSMIHYQT